MFELETALILNRFQIGARLAELEGSEKADEPADDERRRRDEIQKRREEYIAEAMRRLRAWERLVSGK